MTSKLLQHTKSSIIFITNFKLGHICFLIYRWLPWLFVDVLPLKRFSTCCNLNKLATTPMLGLNLERSAENTSLMLIVGAVLIPLLVLKVISDFPGFFHKKYQLGKKGDCGVIAHRGSRQEGESSFHAR